MTTSWFVADDMTKALREARLAQGLSLRQVGALVGVSQSTVLGWERGDRTPSLPNTVAWATSLGFILGLRAAA